MGRPYALLVAILAFLVTVSPTARAGDLAEEAQRQGEFARAELADGEYDRALKSAESALRLDPTLYEALVWKALSYEGLGDFKLAESLILAYREVAGVSELPADVARALERIQNAQAAPRIDRQRRNRGHVVVVQLEVDGPESSAARPDLDPTPYRERSQAAFRLGQCNSAEAAANELVHAAPDLADGYRLLGDAARCASKPRQAVRAYRRYRTLGGEDPAVASMLSDVEATLASLDVTVGVEHAEVFPLLQIEAQGERIDPATRDRTTARFADLPAGVDIALIVAGRGLRAESHDLGSLGPGESRSLEVAPESIGLGTVAVGSFIAETVRVTLQTPDQVIGAESGDELEITAGEFVATIETELGVVDALIPLERGARVEFEPNQYLPAELTIVGVPAGSRVRVFVEGPGGLPLERMDEPASDEGEIDAHSGLRLAAPIKFNSLVGGSGGVFVSHPQLGEGALNLVLESGAANGATFDVGSLSEAARVSQITAAWQGFQAGANVAKTENGRTSIVLGLVGGALIAGGGAALGLSQWAANERVGPDLSCKVLVGTGLSDEVDAEQSSCTAARAWQDRQRAFLGSGAALVGVGLASVTVSVVFGATRRKHREVAETWDPWQVE